MARKQPESEQPVASPPVDFGPEERLKLRALWARLERQWEVCDLHHRFGEAITKYGPVYHQGRTGLTQWTFSSEVSQVYPAGEFDPHVVDTLADHVDWLSRHLAPTDRVYVTFKVVSVVPLSEEHMLEENHRCDELQGVEHEN